MRISSSSIPDVHSGGSNVAAPSSPTALLDSNLELGGYNAIVIDASRDPFNISRKIVDIPELILSKKSKEVIGFYKRQNELIESNLSIHHETSESAQERQEQEEKTLKKVKIAVYGSFTVNLVLFAIQLYAAISSKSLSLLATMADAFMDIVAGGIIVYTSRAAANNQWLKYPAGRKRLETVGTIIFSTLMATLSSQLIIEAIRNLTSDDHNPPKITLSNLIMILVALSLKLSMYFYCRLLKKYTSARAFMVDHRNDLVLNSFGLLMGYLSTKVAWYLDAIGGILLAIFILITWSREAYQNVRLIVGISADPLFLSRLTYMASTHDPLIQHIDTVRAYHVGELIYVELDVVMDPSTPLHISHDVGESLQNKLESLSGVARAFVHVDYEFKHSPEHHPKSN
ncbi:Metal tolerance protein 9 [Smittium culicis]|uniref:Metal tolerance protein 9 n=1 Tax=Smittium culicis TaxID=133412 RepID=A0A1R1XKW9_9FUNG|nr:Metal tolerance protein 9 [Smittium culicis]OMJ15292.1 Metal tolerance protein 9 [Smittium culicis]